MPKFIPIPSLLFYILRSLLLFTSEISNIKVWHQAHLNHHGSPTKTTASRKHWRSATGQDIARAVGRGKTMEEIKKHYEVLLEDLWLIKLDRIPIPNYMNNGSNGCADQG